MIRLTLAAAALLALAWPLWRVVRDGLPWDEELLPYPEPEYVDEELGW